MIYKDHDASVASEFRGHETRDKETAEQSGGDLLPQSEGGMVAVVPGRVVEGWEDLVIGWADGRGKESPRDEAWVCKAIHSFYSHILILGKGRVGLHFL